jgi:Subtilase family
MQRLANAIRAVLVGILVFAACILVDIVTFAGVSPNKGMFAGPVFGDDDDDDDDDDRPRFSRPRLFFSPARRARPAARMTSREWVAAGVTESDVARLQAAGYAIVAQRRLALLPEITVRLRPPRNLSERRAQQQLQALIPTAILDRNHLYRANARPCRADTCFPYEGPTTFHAGVCPARGTIGIIDTGIDAAHPALTGLAIETETMHGPGYRASRSGHGTEVTMLIAAGVDRGTDLKILAIDVFHRGRSGDTADVYDIVAGLDRLVARGVSLANLSLAGPANVLLERAGAEATRRGMLIVAAAGNDGPSSPPRYPAAYAWAIAVTAVDRRDNVYARAVRGPHIAFAAPGVRVQLPDRAMRPGPLRSGTSYAAPLVTAALSARRASAQASPNVVAALAGVAKDIGAPGRDPVFGWGLIDTSKACPAN